MKQNYLIVCILFQLFYCSLFAQVPQLPEKTTLDQTLHTGLQFTNPTAVDTLHIPLRSAETFSLELKAKVNAASNRGLDVFYKNKLGTGFRTSLDQTTFNATTLLTTPKNLSTSVNNAQEQTYRYIVTGSEVYVYLDGYFLTSLPLEQIADATSNDDDLTYGSDNLLGAWAGLPNNNAGKPTDYGWENNKISTIFNTANGGSGVRYMDLSSGHLIESDGSTFNGRLMYIRWDGNSYNSSVYSYPIQLHTGTHYTFSWLYELIANAGPGSKITVAVSTDREGTNNLVSKTFTSGNAFRLRTGNFSFLSQYTGTYYLSITGDWGLFGIGNLQLKSSNLINNWDGLYADNNGAPNQYGWASSDNTVNWAPANTAAGVAYQDVTTGHTLAEDNSTFNGRLLNLDFNSGTNRVFSLPVTLKAGVSYQFSGLIDQVDGGTADLQLALATTPEGSTTLVSQTITTSNTLQQASLLVTPEADATYYLKFTAASGTIGLANLSVLKKEQAQLVIGKDYEDGAIDVEVTSVKFDEGLFAPTPLPAAATQSQTLSAQTISTLTYSKTLLTLDTDAVLHLSNPIHPLINTTINLTSADAQLFFDGMRPSAVIASQLQYINVSGSPAINGSNIVVSSSGTGSVILAHSADYRPLTVYSEENFSGNSQQMQTVIPYKDLGDFDNAIRSIKLKKGYMATLASNADGTGYSKVFIAEDEDLEIAVLEPYLNQTVSFIRTMPWHEVTKKGLASGTNAEHVSLDITWYYNWNTGRESTPDIEYVPIRQTQYWPSLDAANTKAGYTHLLGYNEPDRPDQANMSVDAAIGAWPQLMQSGLRLGSPATSDPFNPWMADFMTKAEARNYRVDYMALHCYWYKSATQWANDLKYIYDKYKRPIWITEWNIGANWTGHSFPDGPTLLTDANATKHKNDLIAVLNVLDNADYVERYSIYNWVQDARAMFVTIDDNFKTRNPNWESYEWLKTATIVRTVEGDTGFSNVVLTPAGAYYATNTSNKAYDADFEFLRSWKPLAPELSYKVAEDYTSIDLNWTNTNFDLITKYVVERKLEGETKFSAFYESDDYTVLTKNDDIHSTAAYRIRVIGKDGTASPWSNIVLFEQEEVPEVPQGLQGEALSALRINLSWDASTDANSYTLQRAGTPTGTFTDIATNYTELTFQDTDLTPQTVYYYRLAATNTGGTSAYTDLVTITTPALTVPEAVTGMRVGSSDDQVFLNWDVRLDEQYLIKRAASENGNFETIATVTSAPYIDTETKNNTKRYYQILAANDAGESNPSASLMGAPKDGRHAYYGFEEAEGDAILDHWSLLDGVASGAYVREAGHRGMGIHLGSGNSFVQLKDGLMSTLSDFSITTWIKLDNLANWNRIFDFGSGTTNWMALEAANGSGKFQYEMEHGGTRNRVTTEYVLPVNEWVHVAVVQAADAVKLYVNGNEVGSSSFTLNPSNLGITTANYLGKSQYSDPVTEALVDEFTIFNYGLTEDAIKNLIDTGFLSAIGPKKNNPADHLFYTREHTLYCDYTGTKNTAYSVFTINGQFLTSGNFSNTATTNLGFYKTGVYVVHIESDTETQAVKVIVR
ncbi:glycosyl hydrolase [Leeuwenhoekiella sp. MAR_2009_132]|uniref:glycosyl hydrolase n=1 Tax=Leeuwenhoekiella sp. MAR_2009_132 TaxID=1392489 RepID=UPI00048DB81D|nr:glycosyl hydrolase [Leeuwenhoekiella sp. MAR_2009_132]